MSEKLKQILNNAIKDEEYFANFYSMAAKKTEVESARKLFITLADQELLHKQKLESLSFDPEAIIPDKVEDVEIAQDLMMTPIEEINDIKEVFKMAIKFEIQAKDMYQQLGACMADSQAKELLDKLAAEEERHETLLKEEMQKVEG